MLMENEVSKNLEKAIEKDIPDAITKALEQACLIVLRDAKKNCPVDDGQLRNSIQYQIEDTTGYVGTNVEYAPYVEKGTGIYNAEGRQTPWHYQDAKGQWHTTKGMKAQPFLQPALDNNMDAIQLCFEGII